VSQNTGDRIEELTMDRIQRLIFAIAVVLTTGSFIVVADQMPVAEGPFKTTWESIQENYKVPDWFRDAKLGIYIHWGVYSVAERGEWYGRRMYDENDPVYEHHVKTYGHPSEFGYKDLIPLWKAQNFDPNAWLTLFKEAGARYFTPCAVHHDGFDLWDSKYQSFNAAKMGPKKDLIAMMRTATLKHGLRFGVTTHLARSYCWFQTSHGADTKGPKQGVPYDGRLKEYEGLYHETHGDTAMRYPATSPAHWKQSWKLRMLDLIDNYQPDLVYLDGAVPFLDDKGQTGLEVLAHYYNTDLKRHGGKQEVVLTYKGSAMRQEKNKGWYVPGIGTRDHEREVPSRLLKNPWQTDDSIGPWGYNTTVPYTSVDQLVDKFVDVVSKNGNLLLNVPPRADGTFDEETVHILKELGKWNHVNGEAIFGTRPWIRFGEGPVKRPESRARVSPFSAKDIRFTQSKDGQRFYAIFMAWPDNQAVITSLAIGAPSVGKVESVSLLGHQGNLKFTQDEDGLKVKMPTEKPCDYAYALRITGVLSTQTNSSSCPSLDLTDFKFDLGSGEVESGYTQVLSTTVYTKELGYGFEPGATVEVIDRGGEDAIRGDFCTSDKPFIFSVKVPEGNYNVMVTLGDKGGESNTTIKAELRRLMLEKVQTRPGEFETRTIIVNIRNPNISTGGQVRLKDRERTTEFAAWDDKLTLEFNGARPCVCAMEIAKADDVPTIYLLGDSTVCDQPLEPWNSWGQMLTRFFKPSVAIANHAESGESIRSSLGARRIDKIMSIIKPADFLFVQFGHNDMKDRSPNALETYKSNIRQLVADTRAKGAIPVLVTSMERKAGVNADTLGDYPETVRQVAKEDNVALIDLHAMSKMFYKALGENIDKAFQDGTHHNNYGSYELAKCVVEGIKQNKLDIAKYIVDDFKGFDPSSPDPVDSFVMPASPARTTRKHEGS